MKTKIYTLSAMIFLAGIFTCFTVHAIIHQVLVSGMVFTPFSLNVMFDDTFEWVLVNGSHTATSTSVPTGVTNQTVTVSQAA